MRSPRQTVVAYLKAFWPGNMETTPALESQDFSLSGPFTQFSSKDTCWVSAAGPDANRCSNDFNRMGTPDAIAGRT